MIQAESLYFSYRQVPVLRGISLTVEAGQVLTLLGPNGSGKTTLLKCLSGVLRPHSGQILIGGKNISQLSPKQLAQYMGILYQNHAPAFPYKVKDMVLMGRTPYCTGLFATPSQDDQRIAHDILVELEITHFAERPYTELSGGERQLVLLARALAQQPKVLFLDEPTAPLDFKNTMMILTKVKELAKSRRLVVIMSLHDPNHALLFSDQIALVKNGELVALGSGREVINSSNLKLVYNMDVEIFLHDGKPFVIPTSL